MDANCKSLALDPLGDPMHQPGIPNQTEKPLQTLDEYKTALSVLVRAG